MNSSIIVGFGMSIKETLKVSEESLDLTILTISTTLILGNLLTTILKINLKLGYLIPSGTSICGGSAMAAVSSVIKAKPKIISVVLGDGFFPNV